MSPFALKFHQKENKNFLMNFQRIFEKFKVIVSTFNHHLPLGVGRVVNVDKSGITLYNCNVTDWRMDHRNIASRLTHKSVPDIFSCSCFPSVYSL
jgi:hypothetical protein